MGNKSKYICFKRGEDEVVVVFSDRFTHFAFKRWLRLNDDDVVSAGFVKLGIDYDDHGHPVIMARCDGLSQTLGVAARPVEDTHLVNKQLGLLG